LKNKHIIKQIKVLRDEKKEVQTDPADVDKLGHSYKLASGLAFVELVDH